MVKMPRNVYRTQIFHVSRLKRYEMGENMMDPHHPMKSASFLQNLLESLVATNAPVL